MEWSCKDWSGEWPDRSGGECNGVELKGLEWRVATSEWRRVEWSGAERIGVESGQIGVEESGVEWRALKELEQADAGQKGSSPVMQLQTELIAIMQKQLAIRREQLAETARQEQIMDDYHCELGAVYSSNFRNNINIKSQDPDSSIYDGWQPGSAV
jgi:hypothetical protein